MKRFLLAWLCALGLSAAAASAQTYVLSDYLFGANGTTAFFDADGNLQTPEAALNYKWSGNFRYIVGLDVAGTNLTLDGIQVWAVRSGTAFRLGNVESGRLNFFLPFLKLPPMPVGQQVHYIGGAGLRATITLEADNQTLTTPAGAFTCLKLRTLGEQKHVDGSKTVEAQVLYLAQGVGRVVLDTVLTQYDAQGAVQNVATRTDTLVAFLTPAP